jgi:hypothetical protein
MEKIRIRDSRWKKFGSGINIPDPQHCRTPRQNMYSRTDPNAHLCCLFADIAQPLVSGTSILANLVFSNYLKDRYNKTYASI